MITEIIQNLFVGDDVDAKDFWYSQEPHISIDLTGWNIDLELNRKNLKTIDKVLPVIKAAFNNDLPTLIYCHAGIDRSPFMVACFIHKELRFSPDYAYKIVKEQRLETIIHDDWMKVYQSSAPTTNQKGGEIMKCGYGVAVKDVGRHNCVGCHWLMKDNTCSWKPEYGVNELDGPTSHPKPRQE